MRTPRGKSEASRLKTLATRDPWESKTRFLQAWFARTAAPSLASQTPTRRWLQSGKGQNAPASSLPNPPCRDYALRQGPRLRFQTSPEWSPRSHRAQPDTRLRNPVVSRSNLRFSRLHPMSKTHERPLSKGLFRVADPAPAGNGPQVRPNDTHVT